MDINHHRTVDFDAHPVIKITNKRKTRMRIGEKRTTEKNMNISQCLPGIWCIRSPFFCCCPMCASLTLYEYIAERHKTANKYT